MERSTRANRFYSRVALGSTVAGCAGAIAVSMSTISILVVLLCFGKITLPRGATALSFLPALCTCCPVLPRCL